MYKTQLHNLTQNNFIFISSSLPTATWAPFRPSLTSRGGGSLWKQGPRQRGRRRSGWSRIECEEDRPLSVGERETNLQFTSETFKLPGEKTQLCTELGREIKKFVRETAGAQTLRGFGQAQKVFLESDQSPSPLFYSCLPMVLTFRP